MKDIRNIFIVEDDKAHRYMLTVILNSWGYATFAAGLQVDILKTIQGRRVDLLMMDINASRRRDVDMLTRIKTAAPLMPVILMTAYSPADMIAEFKKTGAADVLVKPIKLEELEAIFKKVCNNKCRLPSAQPSQDLSSNPATRFRPTVV